MKNKKLVKGPGLSLTINKPTFTKIQPIKSDGILAPSLLPHVQQNQNDNKAMSTNMLFSNYDGLVRSPSDDEFDSGFGFPDPHVAYKIMPAEKDTMALDVTTLDIPEKDLKKGNIIIWDYHGGPNQHFYFKRIEKNRYFILNSSTGFVLEIPNETMDNDIQVHVNPRDNTRGQVWQLVTCGEGLYQLKSFCGKLLDIQYNWIRNGNPVVQYENNNGKNQKWKIWPA